MGWIVDDGTDVAVRMKRSGPVAEVREESGISVVGGVAK